MMKLNGYIIKLLVERRRIVAAIFELKSESNGAKWSRINKMGSGLSF